ncbi:2Fe-2S iron-sulfur cluster-binding protein [Acaryochloris sp. IP29b_bin.137]|uniref:2Fe-2S iron-sulfur cluster-binding protein n=1 Tax=Acaryochloris sp. IP29b_bin.137 TaxID=2969217 RepID=UPI0026334074|nr:2Fe-2S iron-sulfur cluster-binding protein [Acaryochloris sp. IP29b_bin.137]
MPLYQVRFINHRLGLDQTIHIPDDEYILDIAEENQIPIPSACRQGNCSSCLARLISGDVDQSEQQFLDPTEIGQGYTVTCVAYPRSDCVLETHQEHQLYQTSLYQKH